MQKALIAAMTLLPGLAMAQQANTPIAEAETKEAAPATSAPPPSLDEIIVTAQHREQALRDVPLSITAVGGEEMRNQGAISLDSVARLTPNVYVTSERVFMRGFGSANNQTLESSVGFAIDGIAYGRRGYFREGLLDVDRFEVLRGPQGTLFGKNAVAGVISIITGEPDDDFGFRLKYGMGERDHQEMDGAIWGEFWSGGPQGRLAFIHGQTGDYIYNTTTGSMNGFDKRRAFRAKLKFDVSDRFDLLFSLQYSNRWGDQPAGEITALSPEAAPLYTAFDPQTDTQLDHRVQRDEDAATARSSWSGYMKAGLNIGDWRLENQLGYSASDDLFNLDGDFGGAPLIVLNTSEEYYQVSEELRLLSPPGKWELTAGLFYFYSRLEGDNFVPFAHFDDGVLDATLPVLLPSLLAGPLGDLLPDGLDTALTAEQTNADFDQKTTSYAAYGQLRYNYSDRFAIELGVRINYEEKEIIYNRRRPPPSIVLTALGVEEFTFVGDRQEFDVSPKVSALYDVTDDITLYATLARGFKGGGFSTAAIKPTEMIFEPEQSDTLEIGAKGNFWDNRIRANLGTYYMKFNDLQVSNYNGTGFVLSNAAAATAMGVEGDATIIPTDWLIVNGAVGYNFATYDSYPNGVCPATSPTAGNGAAEGNCNLAGRGLAYAPRWNGNLGVLLHYPIGNLGADIFLGAQATYRSNTFLDTDLDPLDAQAAHTLVDMQMGLRDQEERWHFTVTVRNLTDKIIKVASNDIPLFTGSHAAFANQPRTMMGNFEVRF